MMKVYLRCKDCHTNFAVDAPVKLFEDCLTCGTPQPGSEAKLRFDLWEDKPGEVREKKKDTNPKDAVGTNKVPLSCVSGPVMMEVGLAMLEGARKYGRHNYRVAGIRYSIYYDAAMRHLMAWWEGEDMDPDSGLSHVTKAIASLVVLRDAMIQQFYTDDRPPRSPNGWLENRNKLAVDVIEKYPDAKEPFTHLRHQALPYRADGSNPEFSGGRLDNLGPPSSPKRVTVMPLTEAPGLDPADLGQEDSRM